MRLLTYQSAHQCLFDVGEAQCTKGAVPINRLHRQSISLNSVTLTNLYQNAIIR